MSGSNNRDATLTIKARDEATGVIHSAADALKALSGTHRQIEASAQAAEVSFRDLNEAVAAGGAAGAEAAARAYANIEQAVNSAARAVARQEHGLEASRAEYAALIAQMESARVAMRRLQQASQAEGADKVALAAKLKAAEAGYRGLEQQANRAQASIAKQETALAGTTSQLQRLGSQANAAQASLAKLSATATDGGSRKGPLFGLRPHELQNLSFQVNDLVTQVASGTSPMQAFAQQGGQIAQLFPKATGAMLRATPAIAAFTAVLGPVAAAMGNVSDRAESMRIFGAQVSATADGATRDVAQLADVAHRLDVFGTSLANARAAVKTFVAEGISSERLEDFGRAAENLAKVTGQEVPDAAKEFAGSFTKSFEAVAELDRKLKFLTDAERAEIRAMFESGQASEARSRAFDIFARKMDEGAAKARGPWSEAARNVARSWDSFLTTIGDLSPIRGAIGLMEKLAQAAADVTAKLPGASIEADIVRVQARIRDLRAQQQREGRSPVTDNILATRLAELSRLQAAQDKQMAASRKAVADGTARAADSIVADLNRERKALLATSDAQKIAAAGQKAFDDAIAAGASTTAAENVRALAAQNEKIRLGQAAAKQSESVSKREREAAAQQAAAIREANEARRFQLDLLTKTVREQAVLSALRQAEDPAKSNPAKPGASLTAAQQTEIRDTTGALFDQQLAQRSLEAIEAARLQLAEKLGLAMDRQAAIAAQAKQTGVDLATVEGKRFAEIAGAIHDLETAERRAANAGPAVNKLLSDRADLTAQLEFAEVHGERDRAETLRTRIEGVNAELRGAIQTAAAFWRALGGPDADPALLRLEGIQAELNNLGRQILLTRDDAAAMFADAGVGAMRNFSRAIAEGENALSAFGRTMAQTAADVLADLAEMVLRTELMKLAMKTGLADGVAGAVNGFVNPAPVAAGASALQTAGAAVTTGGQTVLTAATALQTAAAALQAAGGAVAAPDGQATGLRALKLTGVNPNRVEAGSLPSLGFARGETAGVRDEQWAELTGGFLDDLEINLGKISKGVDGVGGGFVGAFGGVLTSLLSSIASAIGGGGGGVSGVLAGLFHEGGVVGQGGSVRLADQAWFQHAKRYHTGGIAGLRPNEVPAILKRGEEVLTADDPRHVANVGGAPSGAGPNIKIVNAIDSGDMLAEGIATRAGERALMNYIRANRAGVSSALGLA